MAGKITFFVFHAALTTIFLIATSVISDDTAPIPANKAQLSNWFNNNVKPYTHRKGSLEPALAKAEESPLVIKVSKAGGEKFTTITDAIKSIPVGNTRRVIVFIGAGEYKEKVKIERTKPFVTLYGSPKNMPTLTFDGTAAKYGTVDSATLIVESNYFVAANIILKVRTRPKHTEHLFLACKILGTFSLSHI